MATRTGKGKAPRAGIADLAQSNSNDPFSTPAVITPKEAHAALPSVHSTRSMREIRRKTGNRFLPVRGSLDYVASLIPGGRLQFMEYGRLAIHDHAGVTELMKMWDALTRRQQGDVSLDELVVASGMKPKEFVGIVASAAFEINANISNLMLSVAQPRVIDASIRTATRKDGTGTNERRLLFPRYGITPVSESMQIHINNAVAVQNKIVEASQESGLPRFESDVIELDEIRESLGESSGESSKKPLEEPIDV